jgi:hypothetical protein
MGQEGTFRVFLSLDSDKEEEKKLGKTGAGI